MNTNMIRACLNKINTPLAVAGVIGALMLWRVLNFYGAPDSVLVTIIPDDAFYYIEMARHKAFDGSWTFDGISPTTGFHFLYAYLLVLLYTLFGDLSLQNLYVIVGVMAALSIALSSFLTALGARQLFGAQSIWLAATPFLLPLTIVQASNMMESWLVLLFSAATFYKVIRQDNINFKQVLMLISIGFLGSLSRIDFGMLPGVIFMVDCVTSYITKHNRFKTSGLILVGAVIGVAVNCAHNFLIAGHFLSASSEVKYYWSALAGHDVFAPINFLTSMLSPFYASNSRLMAVLSIGLVVLGIYRITTTQYKSSQWLADSRVVLTIGCMLVVIGYVALYQYNSRGIQNWYGANFIVPVTFLLTTVLIFLFKSKAYLAGIFLIVSYGLGSIKLHNYITYPENLGKMNAGLYIKPQSSDARYASANAGIISYFANHQVVNIDGLANDEMLPYIRSNTTLKYLKVKKINYVVDYDIQILHPELQSRGGYRVESINKCLQWLKQVDGGAPTWKNSRISIFQVLDECGV